MRDKLIELINQLRINNKISLTDNHTQTLADFLLENGLIVPPVKINQTVYVIDRADIRQPIKEKIVLEIQFGYSGAVLVLQDTPLRLRRAYNFGDISKTVFLTREEAERALRGNSNE